MANTVANKIVIYVSLYNKPMHRGEEIYTRWYVMRMAAEKGFMADETRRRPVR